jgi:hypothetical protein
MKLVVGKSSAVPALHPRDILVIMEQTHFPRRGEVSNQPIKHKLILLIVHYHY